MLKENNLRIAGSGPVLAREIYRGHLLQLMRKHVCCYIQGRHNWLPAKGSEGEIDHEPFVFFKTASKKYIVSFDVITGRPMTCVPTKKLKVLPQTQIQKRMLLLKTEFQILNQYASMKDFMSAAFARRQIFQITAGPKPYVRI